MMEELAGLLGGSDIMACATNDIKTLNQQHDSKRFCTNSTIFVIEILSDS